jgi:hypothetical protein
MTQTLLDRIAQGETHLVFDHLDAGARVDARDMNGNTPLRSPLPGHFVSAVPSLVVSWSLTVAFRNGNR